jgi:hypothetical protein
MKANNSVKEYDVSVFRVFCSKARENLGKIGATLRRFPKGIATEQVYKNYSNMMVSLGKIEEVTPGALVQGASCKDICRARELQLEYQEEEAALYKVLFFNSFEYFTHKPMKDSKVCLDGLVEREEPRSQLAQKVESLEAAPQVNPPKTIKGTGAAMDKRLEEWKGQACVMVKVAYQCGLEDKKEVTRTAFEKLATSHGGLSDTAIKLLKTALPDVAKTTPGASRQE